MYYKIVSFIIILIFTHKISALEIKVAVVDNPPPKWTSEKYQRYYMNGLNVEVEDAKKVGIAYKLKIFGYEDPAINIFSVIPKIQQWQPDIVIAPRVSEHFLLLKNQFKNILVLSPYASAEDIYKLPSNFYTLAVSAKFSSNVIARYLQSSLNVKMVYIFTNIECKTCSDYKIWLNQYLNSYTIRTKNINFIDDKILNDKLQYKNIFTKYNINNSAIVLNCTGLDAGILIKQISDYIGADGVNYIGTDSWGTYKDWDIGKIDTKYTYNALRITPKAVNTNDVNVKNFYAKYFKLFGEEPDAISYITFNTLNSVTDSLKLYNCNINNPKENILCSYVKAVSKHQNWHRPIIHEVYKMKKNSEYFVTDIK